MKGRTSKKQKAENIKQLYNQLRNAKRSDWERINQKGHDFAMDNQLTKEEAETLKNQGMPHFTINRITPIVEMLSFFATAKQPRWQAVATEGSDTDVAAIFSDMADYVWHISKGSSIYANAINDCITKSMGYLYVTVDTDADRGMGEVVIKQPDPFDVFVDPKSRDILFRDASYIMIRKVLPKEQMLKLYPEHTRKIKSIKGNETSEYSYTEKTIDETTNDFHYKDIQENFKADGTPDELLEFIEFYEKIRVPLWHVFMMIPPSEEEQEQIQQQVAMQLEEMQAEMAVQLEEQNFKMQQAVASGEMLPARYQLEAQKAEEAQMQQLQMAEQQLISQAMEAATKQEEVVISEKEFKTLSNNEASAKYIVDATKFYDTKVKQCCTVGDTMLYEYELPISEYPIVPFHYKWTGTPYPMSAVSPLIGKQQEMNKAHQLMVHNASLGSSLRWMYFKGSIDEDYWEKYATAPGALLPVNQGFETPKEVMPAQLSNAFFGIVNEGKQDMEYLAGIYGAMQGDQSAQHETYRGMMAMDEYGTRRVKQWLKNSIEPALQLTGELVKQFSQFVYTANKVFRVVNPNNIEDEKEVEINKLMFNEYGDVIGKWNDYAAAKFDVRIIAGSTLPVNRWAYLEELKELMKLGVVDDMAVLAETDIRNKQKNAERKSMYSQMQSQIQSMEEAIKNLQGDKETLERQVIQAGIKDKIRTAEMEIDKEKNQISGRMNQKAMETGAAAILAKEEMKMEKNYQMKNMRQDIDNAKKEVAMEKEMIKKDLEVKEKKE